MREGGKKTEMGAVLFWGKVHTFLCSSKGGGKKRKKGVKGLGEKRPTSPAETERRGEKGLKIIPPKDDRGISNFEGEGGGKKVGQRSC